MNGRPDRNGGLPAWIHISAWSVLLGLALILFLVSRAYAGRGVWSGWRASSDFPRYPYAERVYAHDLFRTRANTWSNLGYVLVGFYGFAFGWHDLRRARPAGAGYLVETPAMSLLFGAACCALGAGSGFFHASLTHAGQRLDVASMYPPLLVLIAVNIGRWIPGGRVGGRSRKWPTWPILGSLVVVASLLLYRYKWSMSARTVLGTLIGTVAVFCALDRLRASRTLAVRWLALAVVTLVAGVASRELDVAGQFTGPDAWLQGHALWHLLTALCLGCMYLYYRSEVVPRQWEATRAGS